MSEQDWKARAEREACAILAEANIYSFGGGSRDTLVSLMAIAWMQGASLGYHNSLSLMEDAFDDLKAAL